MFERSAEKDVVGGGEILAAIGGLTERIDAIQKKTGDQ
jgi:hypothetical protein